MRKTLRSQIEIVVLKRETLDELTERTEYTREELEDMLERAIAGKHVRVFTLFRKEKLN